MGSDDYWDAFCGSGRAAGRIIPNVWQTRRSVKWIAMRAPHIVERSAFG